MVPREQRFIFLSLISGLALVLLLIGLFGVSPAAAYQQPSELAQAESLPLAAQRPGISFTAHFTNVLLVDVFDLAGNLVFEGSHSGDVRCNGDKCNQRVELVASYPNTGLLNIEYKFATGQAIDPDSRRAVVAGTGTIDGGGMKERFSFTATFEDNRDGTISATYVASRPDASFVVPRAPGRMTISSR